MNNKKISCTNIEKLLEYFLHRELTPEDTKLFQEHIETCSECSKKTASDLKIQEIIQSFYSEKTTGEIPLFNWNKFYSKLSLEGTATKIPKLSWIPKFAFASLLGALVIGLSISIFYKIKNIQYIKGLKLPPHSDFIYNTDSGNDKSALATDQQDEEAYIKIRQRRSVKKRKKSQEKKLMDKLIKERETASITKTSEQDKVGIERMSEKDSLYKNSATVSKSAEDKVNTKIVDRKFVGESWQQPSPAMTYSLKKADTDVREKLPLIDIPICNENTNILRATTIMKQKMKKNCYTNDLLEIPFTILGNKKHSRIDIIEILDPSCTNCNNSYNIIKNIIDNYPNALSYKILFYPVKRKNALFFLFAESIYAVGGNDKNNARTMLELILNEMRSDKDRQKRKSVSEWRKYLIKTAKGITNLQQLLLKLRTRNYKFQIYKHIELAKSLKITTPAILFYKDATLTKYVGKQDQETLEKTIEALLKY